MRKSLCSSTLLLRQTLASNKHKDSLMRARASENPHAHQRIRARMKESNYIHVLVEQPVLFDKSRRAPLGGKNVASWSSQDLNLKTDWVR